VSERACVCVNKCIVVLTSVDLDAGENTVVLEKLDEGGAVLVVLEEGLLVKDGAGDVLAEVGGSEEKTYKRASVQKGGGKKEESV